MDVPPVASGSQPSPERDAATSALSALIFREVLKPLAAALGPAGDVVLDRVVDGTFMRAPR